MVRIGSPGQAKTPKKIEGLSIYDDDSMDELANNLLLPGWSEEPPRQSPLRNVTVVDTGPSYPDDMTAGHAEKPLPEIPPKLPSKDLDHSQKKGNLSSQVRSPRVIRRGEKQMSICKLPQSVLLVKQKSVEVENLSDTHANYPRSPNTLKRSMTEVGMFNAKIQNSVNQTMVPVGERLPKEMAVVDREKAPRMSRLQRGRQALAKASRAIAGQLSRSSSTSHTSDKNLVFGPRGDSLPSSSHGSILSLRPNTDDDSSWARHNRRIAEGENLGRPKIKAMTSDGHVRRKPLPLQDTTNLEPSSSCDETTGTTSLVSDSKEGNDSPLRHHDSTVEINPSDGRCSSDDETSSQFDHLQIKNQHRSTTLPRACRLSLNHLVVNGLAQHPNTLVFASPPRRLSVPKTRGVPQANVDSQKRVPSSIKSVVGFEDMLNDDELAQTCQNLRPRGSSNGSVSVKRKSASRDLRSQLSIAMKRTKRGSADSNDSKEEPAAGGETGQQDGVDRPGFITRERNRLSLIFNNKTGIEAIEAERKALGILDSRKENEPISAAEDKSWLPRDRGSGGKKSSSHRRSSLFSRGSRTQTQPVNTNENDDMAIDELQIDSQAYQVGGTK